MSDSTQPGAQENPDSVPAPPAPPAPPVPPAPAAAPSYGTPPPPVYTAPPPYAVAPAPIVPRTLSVVGMILGIVGLVITIFAWGFGFVFSAPAVVLGFLARRREPGAHGMALAAIITGFAGIAVSLIYLAITIALLNALFGLVGLTGGH